MIVYREPDATADPRVLLADCRAQARALADRPDHDGVTGLLVDLGVLEAAVADALFPEADGVSPLADALRWASVACGRLFLASWRGRRPAATLRADAGQLAAELDHLAAGSLPSLIRPKVPEGYAYYALYPETYLAAAERHARDAGPGHAVVVGLRSIGTSLAAVVAAAVEAAGVPVASVTLRPRGHPFGRRPVLTPGLAAELGGRAGSHFLVVDEGPGLSASSLTGTAALLSDLGVPDDRIVLFPSHLPDISGFASATARDRWSRHAKAHAPFEAAFPAGTPWGPGARDLAGGGWRALAYPDERRWPAVHPWWERRKYLAQSGSDGPPVLHKFAGLGRYGRAALARAGRLAEAGFSPPVQGLERGFLRQAWIAGRPLTRRDGDRPEFPRAAVAYLGHLARDHATGGDARPEVLLDLLRVNVAEGLGPSWADRLAGLERHLARFGEVPAVAVDGRMLPQEWLLTPAGRLAKTDAVDHHADHFLPGPADLAWDVAGLAAEFALSEGTATDLAAAVAEAVGDRALPSRLSFYAAAYLAFRFGQATMAADTLRGTTDGERMRRSVRRYRRQLRRAVEELASATDR